MDYVTPQINKYTAEFIVVTHLFLLFD